MGGVANFAVQPPNCALTSLSSILGLARPQLQRCIHHDFLRSAIISFSSFGCTYADWRLTWWKEDKAFRHEVKSLKREAQRPFTQNGYNLNFGSALKGGFSR